MPIRVGLKGGLKDMLMGGPTDGLLGKFMGGHVGGLLDRSTSVKAYGAGSGLK